MTGDGPLLSQLKLLSNRLGISKYVEFIGWMNEDLPHQLMDIDIILNPSLRYLLYE
jgi:glycosyltransferase involved in cell wall biosynthesis